MEKILGPIKILMWIWIVLFFMWFLVFSFASEKILASLSLLETRGFFLRMYGIFPLSWAVLFLFALKDVKKNIAIINGAIIAAALVVISIVIYHFVEGTSGWFHWLSVGVISVFGILLLIFKPKAT